jgi:hypothetical protein
MSATNRPAPWLSADKAPDEHKLLTSTWQVGATQDRNGILVLNLKRLDDTSPTWTRIAVAPDGSILAKGSGSTSKESWATIAPTLKALKDD